MENYIDMFTLLIAKVNGTSPVCCKFTYSVLDKKVSQR